jgi:hypothetical protein
VCSMFVRFGPLVLDSGCGPLAVLCSVLAVQCSWVPHWGSHGQRARRRWAQTGAQHGKPARPVALIRHDAASTSRHWTPFLSFLPQRCTKACGSLPLRSEKVPVLVQKGRAGPFCTSTRPLLATYRLSQDR